MPLPDPILPEDRARNPSRCRKLPLFEKECDEAHRFHRGSAQWVTSAEAQGSPSAEAQGLHYDQAWGVQGDEAQGLQGDQPQGCHGNQAQGFQGGEELFEWPEEPLPGALQMVETWWDAAVDGAPLILAE